MYDPSSAHARSTQVLTDKRLRRRAELDNDHHQYGMQLEQMIDEQIGAAVGRGEFYARIEVSTRQFSLLIRKHEWSSGTTFDVLLADESMLYDRDPAIWFHNVLNRYRQAGYTIGDEYSKIANGIELYKFTIGWKTIKR